MSLIEEYSNACNYPGRLDEQAVQVALASYCKSLGIVRDVKRLTSPWWRTTVLETVISIARNALAALAARNARDARDARNARDALDVLDKAVLIKEFGNWCILRGSWYSWDLSWMASVHIGAVQIRKELSWAQHIFDSFMNGAWSLFWTDETLYWMAKPEISVEVQNGRRRLHCESGPACANDIENLYFWHGVLVPAYAVTFPEMITLAEIKAERNEEVRRVLIERFGWEKYLRESGAILKNRRFNERDHQWEELFQLDDGAQRLIVVDPSTGRKYPLGVPREIETCEQGQAFLSHGLDRFAIHRS